MARPQDGSYDFSEPFDPKEWAMYHERICAMRWISTDFKLGLIIKVGGAAGALGLTVMIGMLGWSLKANYDSTQTAIAAVHQTANEASSETVQKLTGTMPPSNSGVQP